MSEQAGEEHRRAAARREIVGEHRVEHDGRVPGIDQVDRCAARRREQEPEQHAGGVADGRAQELGATTGWDEHRHVGPHLGAERTVRLDDAFRVGARARGVRDDRGARGIDGHRRGESIAVEKVGEPGRVRGTRVADHHDVFQTVETGPHRLEVGEVVDGAEPLRDHEDARLGLPEDVGELARAVVVDDRDDGRTEHAAREPRGGALDPVRQLHRDDVAGPDAEAAEPAGEAGRQLEQVPEGARPRAGPRPDPDRSVGRGAQPPLDQLAEAVVVPPTRTPVRVGEVRRRFAQLPVRHGRCSYFRPGGT